MPLWTQRHGTHDPPNATHSHVNFDFGRWGFFTGLIYDTVCERARFRIRNIVLVIVRDPPIRSLTTIHACCVLLARYFACLCKRCDSPWLHSVCLICDLWPRRTALGRSGVAAGVRRW